MNSSSIHQIGIQSDHAVKCDVCFRSQMECNQGLGLKRPKNRPNDVAVPPYVGPGYWNCIQRVAVMMLNPGAANANHKLVRRDLGVQLSNGQITYSEYNQQLRGLLPEWGFGRVATWISAVGLDPMNIAFLNMALCAVENDEYTQQMFLTCFEEHTMGFLKTLEANVVLLCGKKELAPFADRIEKLGMRVILTWHYRPMHTKRGQSELARVRSLLKT